MKHFRKLAALCLLVLVTLPLLAVPVGANSLEPPGLTVVVSHAPEGLELSVRFAGAEEAPAVLQIDTKAWETYYRFFRLGTTPRSLREIYTDDEIAEVSTLIAQVGETRYEFPMAGYLTDHYDNLATLDWEAGTLTVGSSPGRDALLVLMRVICTLLIEGLVFFIFGYRTRHSWLVFLVVNLLTQGFLNATLNGPNTSYYQTMGLFFLELVIMVAEIITFRKLLRENDKGTATAYAAAANFASLIVGGVLISVLPI